MEEEKKFGIMRKSKLFLLPSYADTWGIVIVVALSCGLPVIAYVFLPVLRQIWGKDVTFVPEGDTESFKMAVVEFLRNPRLTLGILLSKRG